jgi:hypothetical protein
LSTKSGIAVCSFFASGSETKDNISMFGRAATKVNDRLCFALRVLGTELEDGNERSVGLSQNLSIGECQLENKKVLKDEICNMRLELQLD